MITTERNTNVGRLGEPERMSAPGTDYRARHVLERRLSARDRGTLVGMIATLDRSFESHTDPKQGGREGGQP